MSKNLGRKIDLRNYDYNNQEFDVKLNLQNFLFHPQHKLTGRKFLDACELSRSIEECDSDYYVLNNEQWQMFRDAVNLWSGLNRTYEEFVKRILNAEKVGESGPEQ